MSMALDDPDPVAVEHHADGVAPPAVVAEGDLSAGLEVLADRQTAGGGLNAAFVMLRHGSLRLLSNPELHLDAAGDPPDGSQSAAM
jgi:hypothetical protein